MLCLRSHAQQAARGTRFGIGTRGQTRAALAVCGGEADLDDLMLPVIFGRRPTDTGMSFGTGGLLAFPINAKLTDIDALVGISLPLHIATGRTNHFDPVPWLTADQNGCRDIS